MGPLAHIGGPGIAVLVCVVLLAATLGVRAARSARRRRARAEAALAESRAEVAALSRKVEELSDDVRVAGRIAAEDREYVITSLGGAERTPLERAAAAPAAALHRPPVGRVLQEQLVGALLRQQDGSPARTRLVDLVVRTVAVGHGVRRALSPDVLDRAAAEAQVARRRSRRERRRELRAARRLLAVVRHDEDVA